MLYTMDQCSICSKIHQHGNPLQPGPAYFSTAHKYQIFGVACEPLGWQVNYLGEAEYAGNGPNISIILLYHF